MSFGSPLHPRAPAAPPSSSSLGTLGNWTLVERISESRWSRVYRGQPAGQTGPAADYAIKLAVPHITDGWLAVRLLRCEVAVSARVEDPHLISILAHHLGDPPCYTIMPYLAGATLAQRQAGGRPLAVREAVGVAEQTARALRALHHRGLRHGDVAPENIHLGSQGHVTLLDLGSVRPAGKPWPDALEALGPATRYAAPEVLSGFETPSGAADIYSLGIVLFEALSGRCPFEGGGSPERIQNASPRDVRAFWPEVGGPVGELLHAMLSRHPDRRPDADQLLDWLSSVPLPIRDGRSAA